MKKSAFKMWRYHTFYRRVWTPFIKWSYPFASKLYWFSNRKKAEAKAMRDERSASRWRRIERVCWDIVCGGPVTSMKVQRFFRI